MNKHKRVDFIKNSVEEVIGRRLGNEEYKAACERASKYECRSMHDRIMAIVRQL